MANYLKALKDIANATLTASTNLTKYLGILQELRLVERRVPATVPPALQHRSKQGRYHLTDPFHRFYFRFLRPREAEIAYQPDSVLAEIQSELRAFVGQTAWEELARTWIFRQGMQGTLSFKPETIGSHWSRAVQADAEYHFLHGRPARATQDFTLPLTSQRAARVVADRRFSYQRRSILAAQP